MPRLLHEIEIGDWYQAPLSGDRFEVVAVDETGGTVEIQHFDGTVEDIEFESWPELEAQEASPPDDYCGALDGDRSDLLHYGPDGSSANDPLNGVQGLLLRG